MCLSVQTYLFTNIFHIPEQVLLPEDKPHAKYSHTQEEEEALDRDIKELQEKMVTVCHKFYYITVMYYP